MPNKQDLRLEQKQRLRLSQQHLKFVKLLELNAPELDEAVERELDDNPALEALETPDADLNPQVNLSSNNSNFSPALLSYSKDDEQVWDFSPADNSYNLYDFLNQQISERVLPKDVHEMALYLIGNIDSNGYLRRSISNIMDDILVDTGVDIPKNVAEEALNVIRSLDPPGVGASDLRDCLALQLLRLPKSTRRDDALNIIDKCFEEFTMKHSHRIISILGINHDRVRDAIDLILSLNPKPGAAYGSDPNDSANVIIPDFIVENRDGTIFIALNNKLPELAIEESFAEAVDNLNRRSAERKQRKGSEFIISRYNDARDFIKILKQRQQTMMTVMTAITEIQHDYFMTEDVDKMKPMMIKDIAARTGLDISTISRATNNKFVGTPWGVFPLRHFFSDNVGPESNGLTNRKIEAEISRLVDNEDKKHPLSDEKICEALRSMGYDLSRRTVAKYRDRKKIPVARLRKDI